MIVDATHGPRQNKTSEMVCDLCIVGGGIAGVCAAITAARAGISVVFVQDRPVLGGNASSEVRLWILGATSHMGNNNRWAREGGVMDEILVENLWRNPEGNALVFDSLLLEKVVEEKNITLLLNTAVDGVELGEDDSVRSVSAFCSQNEIRYSIAAPLFCDASGDGIVGFLGGAAFRMGAESREEFGELFAPDEAYGELLGHSLYFYSKDVGRPVRYVAPSFALKDMTEIPRYRDFKASDSGCRLWWLEYGGRKDTIYETEEIKWELWRVAYGVWNYIKNSGKFPEAENLTLEWMGTIPGKRESRRFEGDLMLRQQDLMKQTQFEDTVSFGGWAVDLHPSDGVYSEESPCVQWHSKGVYQVPFRALYSRNVPNLFLAGRIISATHVAFGSTRTMATCGHNAQAVAMAAAMCAESGLRPKDLLQPARMKALQTRLLASGQWMAGVRRDDELDLVRTAEVSASSSLKLAELPANDVVTPLNASRAMLLPLSAGASPVFSFFFDVEEATTLQAELWKAEKPGNYTPEVVLASVAVKLEPGKRLEAKIDFAAQLDLSQYYFVVLHKNEALRVYRSNQYVTGVVGLSQTMNAAVAKSVKQSPPAGIGIDTFEFWLPERRPKGMNLAMTIQPPLAAFAAEQVKNGYARPWMGTNAWVADVKDASPALTLRWASPQTIRTMVLSFDTDFDHAMESVLMTHSETVVPFCVQAYRILDANGTVLHEESDNHQTRNVLKFAQPVVAKEVQIQILKTHGAPAAIFEVSCYAE
ncbi:MAG TPA: FAD-dependent oxidoreductase [Acidobacteriaceae bacterium]